MNKPIVVLDANAFISCVNLIQLGQKHTLVATHGVIKELKDQITRKRLQNLPFNIQQRTPTQKSINIIKQFAKKTGDVASLSNNDVEILALTYQLYAENNLQQTLRKKPLPPTQKIIQQQQCIGDDGYASQDQKSSGSQKDDQWVQVPTKKISKEESDDSDIDDEQGWVTSQNYDQKMRENQTVLVQQNQQPQKKQFIIQLMSSDYSIQNVGVQMGIALLAVDGRKIKQVKRFIWQCYLCWTQYQLTDNKVKLCSNCGYNSLSKVSFSIDSKGNKILHRKKGWKPNQKVLQWKQRKLQQQQKHKKHQHQRRKKKPSIFQTY